MRGDMKIGKKKLGFMRNGNKSWKDGLVKRPSKKIDY